MGHMTTLGKVLDHVWAMSEKHIDRYVPTRDVSFQDMETVNIAGELFPLKPIAQQGIANRLGIPAHYLRKCPPDIQRMNLNHWIKKERNDQLFFRFSRNEVRAVFTPRYIPTDNVEVLEHLRRLGYRDETPVQASFDENFLAVNIPDGDKMFSINGDRMTPGISISNSEVGIAALSVSFFLLRLICSNGMISKTEVAASYRHVSAKILSDFPEVLGKLGRELDQQRNQLRISLESSVTNPESTIANFNRQFQLNQGEKDAVSWATPLEYGNTMFNVINTYTKAAQFTGLSADSSYKLQRVGGMILGMVN